MRRRCGFAEERLMGEKARAIALGVVLVALVGGMVWWWMSRPGEPVAPPPAPVAVATTVEPGKGGRLVMVEVGASGGPANQMMAAVMTTLRVGFGTRLEVRFVNVDTDAGAKEKYGVTVVPTQIFYSPEGKELGRHEAYITEQQIIDKWKELGHDLMAYSGKIEELLPPEESSGAGEGE